MGYLDPGPRGELRHLGERAEREVAGVDVQLVRLQAGQELVLCGKANVTNYRSYYCYHIFFFIKCTHGICFADCVGHLPTELSEEM